MATDITAPIDLALDTATNDLDLTAASGVSFTAGLAAVAQGCRLAITLIKGEWFLDQELGIPFFTDVAGAKFDQDKILGIYRSSLLSVENVVSVSELTAVYNGLTRSMVLTFVVLTPWGETPPQLVEV